MVNRFIRFAIITTNLQIIVKKYINPLGFCWEKENGTTPSSLVRPHKVAIFTILATINVVKRDIQKSVRAHLKERR
jgi:hypothetical protein